jgi:hypothetical protein
MNQKNLLFVIILITTTACAEQKNENWVSIFNGENLDGWTVKFSGYELGENYKNTFRAGYGILSANYDEYENFNAEWGHIFYKEKLSHYRLRLEYRFTGDTIPGAPEWAIRNNGIMFHTQSPDSMEIIHGWPVSLEFQLLGGLSDGNERPTGNVCTPGTHILIKGELVKQHCINSTSKTFDGDQWVKAELEVKDDEIIRHYINGELVFEYTKPIADASDPEQPAHPYADALPIKDGYIALQAEGHPTDFRNIELLKLD